MDNHTPELRPGTFNPDPNKQQTPALIAGFLDRIGNTDLTVSVAFYMPSTGRKRIIRLAGRQSLNAVLRVLLANVDIATSTVTASQSNLAKQPAGANLSKTRFCRALKELERAGLIYFSGAVGHRPIIVLSVLGLEICGISPGEWCAAGGALCGRDSLR